MPTPPTKTASVVLVHGAWADGSSWRRVIPLLHAQGIAAIAVQNPTTSLADDVAATKRAIARVDGPVVLAGHSWGGMVITEAGNDPRVKGLVYVAAFAPDAGQSSSDLLAGTEATPGLQAIQQDGPDGLLMSVEGWINAVAQDLPEQDARVLAAVQPPLGAAAFGEPVTAAAWRSRPTWYVVSENDRSLSADLQRSMAGRIGAKTTVVKASHMSPLSAPDAIAAVLAEAAQAVAS